MGDLNHILSALGGAIAPALDEADDPLVSLKSRALPSTRSLSMAAAQSAAADVGLSGAPPSARRLLQVCRPSVSLTLSEYANALSNSNPNGDIRALYRFRQLVDPVPAVGHVYEPTADSLEMRYGHIVDNARVPDPSRDPLTSEVVRSARANFDVSSYVGMTSAFEWRPIYPVPDDWWRGHPQDFTQVEIDLDGDAPPSPGIEIPQDPASLTMRIGRVERPLSPGTALRHCSLQYLFVKFSRPWFDSSLFRLSGWQLKGQERGICSTGTLDDNNGLLPIVPVGMILTHVATFGGDWDPADRDRLDSALAAGERVFIGPYEVGDPQEQVTRVQLVSWVCDIVPMSPQLSGLAGPGLIRVVNKTKVVARCIVTWTSSDTGEAGHRRGLLEPREIFSRVVPADATDIVVQVGVKKEQGWREGVVLDRFNAPPTKDYELRGPSPERIRVLSDG